MYVKQCVCLWIFNTGTENKLDHPRSDLDQGFDPGPDLDPDHDTGPDPGPSHDHQEIHVQQCERDSAVH